MSRASCAIAKGGSDCVGASASVNAENRLAKVATSSVAPVAPKREGRKAEGVQGAPTLPTATAGRQDRLCRPAVAAFAPHTEPVSPGLDF